ncbi:hypothetical protein LNV23_12365 [Paucibacter sp. DJ1R-11]|uniref:hypothetical protein n=1 Tax=Paucibacter sp. DJ1R-11 TaxID=2893556 RepID=UPI0021E38F25|nr:hypothetical protein [Paucibacter sp. DJ1R-11]MCV2364239.1 hypothetical protein [Paucibacter sp. DJ1R-11]
MPTSAPPLAPSATGADLAAAGVRLADFQLRFVQAHFEEVLQALEPLLEELRHRHPPSAELHRLHVRGLLLRMRSLSKFDRLEDILHSGAEALELLAHDGPTVERAEVFVFQAFAYNLLAWPQPALSATQLALQDALALGSTEFSAQAMERAAMCYLSMGDGLLAERFMLEAIGFAEQCTASTAKQLRYSNALHLACVLFDAYQDCGEASAASQLLPRFGRVQAQGEHHMAALAHSCYIDAIWHGNQARWLRRAGQTERAGRLLREVLALALARDWQGLIRPMRLELSLELQAAGLHAQALQELQRLFEPLDLPLRETQALRGLQAMARSQQALGQSTQAEQTQATLALRLHGQRERIADAQRRLAGLDQRLVDMLQAADRARIEQDLQSMGQRAQQARVLRVPGMDWLPVALPA